MALVESPAVPRLARLADIVCLLFAIAAVIVAVSGGFRGHVGGLRIAVTSPFPLLIWALAVGIARHVTVPREPLYRDLPRRLTAWSREPGVRSAATVVVGTCPAMLFVGYLAVFMFGYAGGRAPLRYFDNELLNLPVRWDAGWYLQIVIDGYTYNANEPQRQQNIVFFPAYPMLVRYLGRLFGGHMSGYIAAGIGLSLSAFLGALVYLYALARDQLGDDEARYALWLIATYPFALFFGAIYTESLFLLGATAAWYHMTKQHYGRASLWGLLVGLTRPNGVFLSVALALLVVAPRLPSILGRRGELRNTRPLRPASSFSERERNPSERDFFSGAEERAQTAGLGKALGAAAMPGVGMLLYAAVVWRITGHPLAWAEGHLAWGRTHQGIWALVAHQYTFIANAGLSGYMATPGYDVLNTIGVLFAIAAVWPVARRLGIAYAVFILINLMPALAEGGLLSAGRFSSVLFPAFIWLASAIPARHRTAWVVTFAAIQAFNAALFYTWRPLF
jgi:hypothetical protein